MNRFLANILGTLNALLATSFMVVGVDLAVVGVVDFRVDDEWSSYADQ